MSEENQADGKSCGCASERPIHEGESHSPTHPLTRSLAHSRRLSNDLRDLAQRCEQEDLTVGRLLELLRDRGFGLLLVVLSLPSALPVPAPGYSTPFGAILFLLGLQLVWGRTVPWLPQWARRRSLTGKTAQRILKAGIAFFGRIEHLLHPRFGWMHSRAVLRVVGVLVCGMALLMATPIPLTNTLPAMVIFALGIGMIEKDGFALLAGLAFAVLAAALYATIFSLVAVYGLKGVEEVKPIIKEWLGR